mgnify:FL=1
MLSFKQFIKEELKYKVIPGNGMTTYRILHPKGEEHGYQDVVITHSSKEAAVPVASLELKNHVGEQPPKFGGVKAIGDILNHFKKNYPVKEMYAVAENPEHKEHFQRIISKLGYEPTKKGFKLNESTSDTVENIMKKAKKSAEESEKITPAVAGAAAASTLKLTKEMKEIHNYMQNNSDFAKNHRKRFDDAISALNIGREDEYNNHLEVLKKAMEDHQSENM